jgi:hypothetical protein
MTVFILDFMTFYQLFQNSKKGQGEGEDRSKCTSMSIFKVS